MILQSQNAPPVPEKDNKMDNPPPYTPNPDPSGAPEPRNILTRKPTDVLPASVTQIHLFSNKEDLSGTFHIDPSTTAHGDGPTIRTKHGKMKRRKGKKKGKDAVDSGPHASFQTRSGNVKLQLGSTLSAGSSGSRERVDRANIFVGTRKGKVEVTLLPRDATPPGGMTMRQPFIGLDVFSRSGDVIVYLPETFSGVVKTESVKGEMQFLPALASGMRVLKKTERETMVTLGDEQGDLCEIFTRKGRIVVGIAGRDLFMEEVGFWRKLFSK